MFYHTHKTFCQACLFFVPIQLFRIYHYHLFLLHLNLLLIFVTCTWQSICVIYPTHLQTYYQHLLQYYHLKNHNQFISISGIWNWIPKHSITYNFTSERNMWWINSLHYYIILHCVWLIQSLS